MNNKTLIKKSLIFLLIYLNGLKNQRLFNKNYAMHNFYPTTKLKDKDEVFIFKLDK